MKRRRWPNLILAVFLLISSTACSCGDRIAGIFGKKATTTPAATPEPTVVLAPLIIPDTSNTAFEGEMSEKELEGLVQKIVAGEASDYVSDITIQITTQAVLATVQVTASQINITFKVTLAGVPRVVDGKAYLQVTQITLDDSLSGWTRLSAKSLVQEVLDKYAGENGIPIEFDNLYIETIELREHKLFVRGKTL